MKQILIALILALASGVVQAQKVFRVKQPDGTILFTDVPPTGAPAQQIEVPPLNTTAPLASPTGGSTQATGGAAETGYSTFRITRPGNDESIRDNAGSVNVDLSLEPKLRSGDKIDLFLDGQSIGGGKSTAITLTDMDRGSHSIRAVVKNSAGEVVARSNTVTFTLQRRSAILQPGPPRPAPF